jgi:predicted nucleic acid-binding protein
VAGNQSVLLDTDAFSALYISAETTVRKQGFPLDEWRAALTGCRIVISFQTHAEVLAGALGAGWDERKMAAVRDKLDQTPTVQLDQEVFDAFVELTVASRADGAAIGQKIHTADRWIAASAIAKGFLVLSRDRGYASAPGLQLFEVPHE